MRILVTGAAGFIGSTLSHRLLERGDEVLGYDNLNAYYDPKLKEARLARLTPIKGFSFVRAALEDRAAMEKAFADFRPQRVHVLFADFQGPDHFRGSHPARIRLQGQIERRKTLTN